MLRIGPHHPHVLRLPLLRRWAVGGLLIGAVCGAVGVAPASAREWAGAEDAVILRETGSELRARAAELVPTVTDRASAFDALVGIVQTRQEIVDALVANRRMTDMEGITLADAIDDSLAHHAASVLIAFEEKVPEPLATPGTEKFKAGLMRLGFVGEFVTGFLWHLEFQQALLILQEFRTKRGPGEAEAAEDSFLRHFTQLAKLHRVQHVDPRERHLCNVANMDWAVGRFEAETGTNDFYVASQFFASRDSGFSYFLKLASPTTGETVEVHYPLPHLTSMDEGWQAIQAEKAAKAEEAAKGEAEQPN